MSSFYDYLYSVNRDSDKTVEDKAPGKANLTGGYFVFCRDRDGTLKRLIEAIGKHGNSGHTYDIVLDPDCEKEKETFCWDGDGSDRIDSIIAVPEGSGKDNPLLRMCLQTLDSIKWQAREASRKEQKGWGEPPPTEEERERILDNIIHDSSLLLEGCNFEDNRFRKLESIKEYCENCLRNLQSQTEGDKPLTVEKALKHIREIAAEGLEKGITYLS